MMHFLCIKWGDKYPPDYVNNLYHMVNRNYSKRFKFFCYTDEPEGLDKKIQVRSIPKIEPLHPKYWFGLENYCWDRAKFLLFNSHYWLKTKGPFCYLDLDVVIQNNIDDFFDLATEGPHMIYSHWDNPKNLKDRAFTNIRGTPYNSSVMLWNSNQCEKIYQDVLENKDVVFKTFFKGSDNYHYWRESQVVGENFWSFLPDDWVYSYNRGKKYPEDMEEYLYREDCKVCLFNTDLVPGEREQYKPHELKKDYDLLIHWHGKDDFERLWLPKLPENFFDYTTKDLLKIKDMVERKDHVQIADKFLSEFPRFIREWDKYHTDYDKMKNWLGFEWLKERNITDRYLNYNAHQLIKDNFDRGDLVSVHKTFAEAFSEDPVIADADQSMLWNMTYEEICETFDTLYAYQRQDWLMSEYIDNGPSVFFWHATYEELAELYKKYYFHNLTELFYNEKYEEVFERLYNIMPREELMRVLNQKGDDNTLFKYFQSYGEEYSDLYKGLYDEEPDGVLLQISTARNDTGNDFNDIFVDGKQINKKILNELFSDYRINWVTLTCEIADPVKCDNFIEVCEFFNSRDIPITLQTRTENPDLQGMDIAEVVYVKEEEKSEENLIVSDYNDKGKPVDLETLKRFGHTIETRNRRTKAKDKDPVWCDARKSAYFYINSSGNTFPCAFIARDVTENKLFPYHPIDYPFNIQYNDGTKFSLNEIIYNSDMQNISEHLKRNPLPICKKKCGDCNAC